MTLYSTNTVWKRQLQSLLQSAVAMAALNVVLALYIIVATTVSSKIAPEYVFFDMSESLAAVIFLMQVFVSGLLLGAEEEENQTHSFILRLPVSKARWVLERLLAALLGFIVCLVLVVIEDIIFGIYFRIPRLADGLVRIILQLLSFSNIVAALMYFWVCAFFGAAIKKVLPSAGASLLTVILVMVLLANVAERSILWAMRHTTTYFLILAFIFMGLYILALSRREGT
jgi:hypothetical protein